MSIITNGLLGSSRNKVGNIVTYRMKGQDIARSKAAQVSNPRTNAQQSQRVKLANLVALYRVLSAWMDGIAFQSKPQRWSDYNAFVSANIGENRVVLTKQQAAAGYGIVAPYIVTRGSLPTIEINPTTANVFQSNIQVGDGLTIGVDTTIGAFSTAILNNNNGLVQGMQLSLVMVYQLQQGGAYYPMVRYFEVILDINSTELLATRMDVSHLGVSNGALAFVRGETDPITGFTFILSHTVANQTRVSTQRLTLTSTEVYDLFSSAQAQTEAIESYGASLAEPFLVSNYGDGGVNPDVYVLPSIISVAVRDRNPVAVGEYLGSVGTENAYTLTIRTSQALDELPTSVRFTTQDSTVEATSVAFSEGAIVASFAADSVNPSYPIRSVGMTLQSGVVITASFNSDATSGSVTE